MYKGFKPKPEVRVHTSRLCVAKVTVCKFCLFFFNENEMFRNTAYSDQNRYKRSDRVVVNCNRHVLSNLMEKRCRPMTIGFGFEETTTSYAYSDTNNTKG